MGVNPTDDKEVVENEEADTSKETADDTGDNKGDAGADDGKPDASNKDDKSDKQPDKKPDDGEPPVRARKTPKDFIIERKQRQLDKAKAKSGDADEGDDDDVDPADERIISSVVRKQIAPLLKPFLDRTVQEEDEKELTDFLAKPENAEFKPYVEKVRRYMAHPSRSHIPVDELFYSVAGRDLMKIGARKAKDADDQAARGKAGGSQGSNEKAKSSAFDLSKDEFEAKRNEILRKPRS